MEQVVYSTHTLTNVCIFSEPSASASLARFSVTCGDCPGSILTWAWSGRTGGWSCPICYHKYRNPKGSYAWALIDVRFDESTDTFKEWLSSWAGWPSYLIDVEIEWEV